MKKLLKGKAIRAAIGSLTSIFLLISSIQPVPLQASSGYWRTDGGRIVDTNNQTVRVAGVNWFGLETGSYAPHGLWSRNYKDLMNQIKDLGFNTIRLPFSNEVLNSSTKPNGIDYQLNPDLANLSSLEIMDRVVSYAGAIGLRVVLDRHRPDANAQSSLWYTDNVPESKWISDWELLAKRYANNPTVVGVDLHNEPHDSACWGCGDSSRDWKMAAEKAGNAILAVNPNLLIIVEGVQAHDNNWYWWGGNLAGVRNAPINLKVANRVVYSPHDYPSSVNPQPWFNEANYPQNLPALWDRTWGYIQKEGIAPVIIGEFGTKLESESDRIWLQSLTNYLKQTGISWMFWSFNPNSGDTGGILMDDWKSVRQDKLEYLKSIQGTVTTPISVTSVESTKPSSSPTPTPAATPIQTSVPVEQVSTTPSQPSPLTFSYTIREQWGSTFIADISVKNSSSQPVKGWKLEWDFANGQQIKQMWGGEYSQNGNRVTVMPIWWSETIPANSSVTWGFLASHSGTNLVPTTFSKVATVPTPVVSPTPQPSATPLPSTSPVATPRPSTAPQALVQISSWWPLPTVAVSGVQPFKAVANGLALSDYTMYWQVDGGVENVMENSFQDAPHKEARVDISGWNWRGNGPYKITLTAKNRIGTILGQTTYSLMIAR